MDDWDPAVVNEIARHREVVVFDNVGVGGSSGTVPDSPPDGARRAANTAHQGGGNDLLKVLGQAMAQKTHADPRMVLFFPPSAGGVAAGREFLGRVGGSSSTRFAGCVASVSPRPS